eukprot:COSAG04_NODE_6486_length_1316_cov_2.350530_1_plen_120_part_10
MAEETPEERLRSWLDDRGAEHLTTAVAKSFQGAGYDPSEWVETLSTFSPDDLASFLKAISTHYGAGEARTDGEHQVTLHKGSSGFGMQIDRDGYVLSYGAAHCESSPSPAQIAGVEIGSK